MKHEDVFKEMIERDLPAGRMGLGFGEQKIEGRDKLGKSVQRNHKRLWKGGG